MSVLTPDALAWVAGEVGGPGARPVRTRHLTGGIASVVTAVSVELPTGRRRRVVVRRPHPDLLHTAAELVRQEAGTLATLEGRGLPAPRLLAVDADGSRSGEPTLVMSMLSGRMQLAPDDRPGYLRQIAETALRIHDVPAPASAPEFAIWVAEPLTVPVWSTEPDSWRAAIATYAGGPPAGPRGFVHHDLQHFNLLWTGDRLTGVTDWTWASRNGPLDADIGHCRLNLAVLHGAAVAEEFRLCYEARAGRPLDPWWDVVSVLSAADVTSAVPTQVGRRMRVSPATMQENVDAHLRAALSRI